MAMNLDTWFDLCDRSGLDTDRKWALFCFGAHLGIHENKIKYTAPVPVSMLKSIEPELRGTDVGGLTAFVLYPVRDGFLRRVSAIPSASVVRKFYRVLFTTDLPSVPVSKWIQVAESTVPEFNNFSGALSAFRDLCAPTLSTKNERLKGFPEAITLSGEPEQVYHVGPELLFRLGADLKSTKSVDALRKLIRCVHEISRQMTTIRPELTDTTRGLLLSVFKTAQRMAMDPSKIDEIAVRDLLKGISGLIGVTSFYSWGRSVTTAVASTYTSVPFLESNPDATSVAMEGCFGMIDLCGDRSYLRLGPRVAHALSVFIWHCDRAVDIKKARSAPESPVLIFQHIATDAFLSSTPVGKMIVREKLQWSPLVKDLSVDGSSSPEIRGETLVSANSFSYTVVSATWSPMTMPMLTRALSRLGTGRFFQHTIPKEERVPRNMSAGPGFPSNEPDLGILDFGLRTVSAGNLDTGGNGDYIPYSQFFEEYLTLSNAYEFVLAYMAFKMAFDLGPFLYRRYGGESSASAIYSALATALIVWIMSCQSLGLDWSVITEKYVEFANSAIRLPIGIQTAPDEKSQPRQVGGAYGEIFTESDPVWLKVSVQFLIMHSAWGLYTFVTSLVPGTAFRGFREVKTRLKRQTRMADGLSAAGRGVQQVADAGVRGLNRDAADDESSLTRNLKRVVGNLLSSASPADFSGDAGASLATKLFLQVCASLVAYGAETAWFKYLTGDGKTAVVDQMNKYYADRADFVNDSLQFVIFFGMNSVAFGFVMESVITTFERVGLIQKRGAISVRLVLQIMRRVLGLASVFYAGLTLAFRPPEVGVTYSPADAGTLTVREARERMGDQIDQFGPEYPLIGGAGEQILFPRGTAEGLYAILVRKFGPVNLYALTCGIIARFPIFLQTSLREIANMDPRDERSAKDAFMERLEYRRLLFINIDVDSPFTRIRKFFRAIVGERDRNWDVFQRTESTIASALSRAYNLQDIMDQLLSKKGGCPVGALRDVVIYSTFELDADLSRKRFRDNGEEYEKLKKELESALFTVRVDLFGKEEPVSQTRRTVDWYFRMVLKLIYFVKNSKTDLRGETVKSLWERVKGQEVDGMTFSEFSPEDSVVDGPDFKFEGVLQRLAERYDGNFPGNNSVLPVFLKGKLEEDSDTAPIVIRQTISETYISSGEEWRISKELRYLMMAAAFVLAKAKNFSVLAETRPPSDTGMQLNANAPSGTTADTYIWTSDEVQLEVEGEKISVLQVYVALMATTFAMEVTPGIFSRLRAP
jgi:hypothetical protein